MQIAHRQGGGEKGPRTRDPGGQSVHHAPAGKWIDMATVMVCRRICSYESGRICCVCARHVLFFVKRVFAVYAAVGTGLFIRACPQVCLY